jgi:hypothetical protein
VTVAVPFGATLRVPARALSLTPSGTVAVQCAVSRRAVTLSTVNDAAPE